MTEGTEYFFIDAAMAVKATVIPRTYFNGTLNSSAITVSLNGVEYEHAGQLDSTSHHDFDVPYSEWMNVSAVSIGGCGVVDVTILGNVTHLIEYGSQVAADTITLDSLFATKTAIYFYDVRPSNGYAGVFYLMDNGTYEIGSGMNITMTNDIALYFYTYQWDHFRYLVDGPFNITHFNFGSTATTYELTLDDYSESGDLPDSLSFNSTDDELHIINLIIYEPITIATMPFHVATWLIFALILVVMAVGMVVRNMERWGLR